MLNECVYIIYLSGEITFWLLVLVYYLCDMYLSTDRLEKLKLYSNNKGANNGYTWKTVKLVLINHFIISPIYLLPLSFFYKRTSFNDNLPDPLTICCQLIFICICQDVQFYIYHRILHIAPLYKYIHKIHHEFKYPIAISSQYVHPIEYLILYFQIISGPVLINIHPILFACWIVFVTVINVSSHSGYFSQDHFLHHKLTYFNFGTNSWFDMLFYTYRNHN